MLWSQVSGPQVTLSSTTTLTPTFTYPKMALPVGPAGHVTAGYVVHNEPIVLQLTATPDGGGTAGDRHGADLADTGDDHPGHRPLPHPEG